jgi:hypothetical protein
MGNPLTGLNIRCDSEKSLEIEAFATAPKSPESENVHFVFIIVPFVRPNDLDLGPSTYRKEVQLLQMATL